MANEQYPHTPPWAPFLPVPRSAGRTAALNSPSHPPRVRPHTDAQVPLGREVGAQCQGGPCKQFLPTAWPQQVELVFEPVRAR